MKAFKIIAINIITFAILLAAINWGCKIYLKRNDGQSGREALPNFDNDRDHATQVFRDYYSVKHHYEPFVGWKCIPFKGQTTTILTDGRRVVPTASNEPAAQEVHFFGGSTMWGEGSDDAHTIPALFNKINPQYKSVNHGQLAYNSRQELDALISLYSKKADPDIVVFYDGVNDAAFLCPSEIKQLPAHRLVPMYREKLYAGSGSAMKELFSKIFFGNILKVIHKFTYKPTAENSAYDCLRTPGKAEEIAEIMMSNWELAHQIVTQRGGKFIAVLQPAAFISKPKTDHLKLDKELGENFSEVYKHLKKKIAERNHPWVHDLSDQFDGDEHIFIDFCHVSPNGNEIIAKRISEIVRSDSAALVSNVND